jgi:bla regulator protein BlaR1
VTGSFAILSLQRRSIALAALAAFCGSIALIQPVTAGTIEADGRTSYVLLTAGSRSSMMSGTTDDLRRARALRVGREGLLYVRQGGDAYVIRDAATLRRAEAIFEPQQALGARQAELGSRQAALGSRQAALGAEQARLGARQAGASPRQAEALGRQQDALGRQQDALGRQQDALGRQQDALGREQGRLGREAQGRLGALMEEAIRRGVAQRTN